MTNRRTILVVDDQDVVRRLLELTLSVGDFEVLQAADGVEALRIVKEHRPDLVILDALMPGVSGFETCQAIRSDPSFDSVSIVFLTSLGSSENLSRAEAVGADAYIVKPFSPLALLSKIDSLLSEKDGRRPVGWRASDEPCSSH